MPNLARPEYLNPVTVHSGCTKISIEPVKRRTGFILKNWNGVVYLFERNEMFKGISCHLNPSCTFALSLSASWKITGEGITWNNSHDSYIAPLLVSSCENTPVLRRRSTAIKINLCFFMKTG